MKEVIKIVLLMGLLFPSKLLFAQEVSRQSGNLYVNYNDKKYELMQYEEGDSFRFYSLQYYSTDENMLPDALVLIMDNNGKVVKEITNTEYWPKMTTYDLDGNGTQDLILFWQQGAHSQTAEAWLNQDNKDFLKVFEEFNDKNILFTIRDGVPTLAFKKEYPMPVSNDNFLDKEWHFKKWDGKTFR